ncbi:MAG: glycoside hydrolase family 2 protein, partial [Pseudomonadota bacterium]
VVAGRALQDAHPFEIPWSKNCPIPYGNFLRKPACDFGWDWNIALAPFGLYGKAMVEPSKSAHLESVLVHQEHGDGTVDVTVTLALSAEAMLDVPYRAQFGDMIKEGTVSVLPGRSSASVTFHIEDPDLWWPAGHGAQPLYPLRVEACAERRDLNVGLRKMELVNEVDDHGLGFKIRVNGRDIFCKGANWIPADALPGRISDDKTHALLQSAAEANMNMIRVWGGGRYEPDSFYESCDALGLLVWQDFMFACNLYPSDTAFLDNVKAEVRDNVGRIQHHACLALWCGDNELVGALGWYDVSVNDRDRYLVNYDRLNRAIEETLFDVDAHANWWPSSPTAGPMDFRDTWHIDGSGDMHFWSVWHEGRDFDHYRDVAPRFCSEFGFQSYPSMDVVGQFTSPAEQNIANPVFESHQKNEGGNARIAETMFRYYRWPERFDDFVWLSQIQQAEAIKTAVTHWRGQKPRCMGTIYWQLNDTWPVCSWASLDYGGGWKLLHHFAAAFFAPCSVVVDPREGSMRLLGVNDHAEPVDFEVVAWAADPSGRLREVAQGGGTVGKESTEIAKVDPKTIGEDEVLVFEWSAGEASGHDIYAPKPWKAYDLKDPQVTQTVRNDGDVWTIELAASALALFVTLEASIPGRFDRNAIHILPGRPVTFAFRPALLGDEPKFTLRHLQSATMARPQ